MGERLVKRILFQKRKKKQKRVRGGEASVCPCHPARNDKNGGKRKQKAEHGGNR